ncbi:MAG: DEAD/DEAH box helicase [Verrucomicrobiales bacterium]|nr:DEAD/DEAH box helicase [Verrucomicrobiales bacterium]
MNTGKTFSDLGLPPLLLEAVSELGFEEPSAIQAATIPVALEGHDIVGLSETGSGKTAAFGLPALSQIDFENPVPQLLVICPTRELAVQVCEEISRLGSKLPKLKTVAIYGGAPMDRQFRALRQGTQVIVGTPGRLIDHVERGSLNLDDIKMVILDEADRMLDMGFFDEMQSILRAVPEERQTLFFSATMNRNVEGLIKRFGNEPRTIQIERKTLTVESVEQVAYEVRQRSKTEVLSRILDLEQPRLAIVFCNTKRNVDECTEALLARGYSADRLHGDISQALRERVLRMFREGTVEVLVATDVAARGIDIDDIDVVFNYDLPQDPEDYVHRIGRTGRAGRSGKAVSFIFGRDVFRLQTIERYIRQQITRAPIPSQAEVEGKLASQLIDGVREKLESKAFEDSSADVKQLQEAGFELFDIANTLMAMLREGTSREGEEIIEDRHDSRDRSYERERSPGKDRGDRRKRNERFTAEEGMTRLFLNLGKAQRISPGDIVGMMHNEMALPREALGKITMTPKFTLIEIANDFVETALAEAKKSKLRGKRFVLDYDRSSGAIGEKKERSGKPDSKDRKFSGKKGSKPDRERRGGKTKGRYPRKDN